MPAQDREEAEDCLPEAAPVEGSVGCCSSLVSCALADDPFGVADADHYVFVRSGASADVVGRFLGKLSVWQHRVDQRIGVGSDDCGLRGRERDPDIDFFTVLGSKLQVAEDKISERGAPASADNPRCRAIGEVPQVLFVCWFDCRQREGFYDDLASIPRAGNGDLKITGHRPLIGSEGPLFGPVG